MAYTKHNWECGESITADKLNHMEDGISDAHGGGSGEQDCAYIAVVENQYRKQFKTIRFKNDISYQIVAGETEDIALQLVTIGEYSLSAMRGWYLPDKIGLKLLSITPDGNSRYFVKVKNESSNEIDIQANSIEVVCVALDELIWENLSVVECSGGSDDPK